ncbi:MAG: hypothetical protein GTO63_34510 [Anaerolineae bacterium]|nr:hypothetical protein [Anaerolineae bacterium]NIN99767.1 hypothetical protein [Anaerolineae bacterium]
MNKNVAVVGNGPAGLLATWAALHQDANVTVFHLGAKSEIHGAQYIHADIPGLPDLPQFTPFTVRYHKHGSEEGYRQKIYGDSVPQGGTSWDKFHGRQRALPMHEIYDYLYDTLMGQECRSVVKLIDERDFRELVSVYDVVVNTAPLPSIKPDGVYRTEDVWVVGHNIYHIQPDEIHYYGDEKFAYRASNIQGHGSAEFPTVASVPFGYRRQARKVHKPLDCDVSLPGVHRLGRYGKWKKGVLAHEAYSEMRDILRRDLPWTASLAP